MYLSTVDSDHSVAASNRQLGHFFHHLLHLGNNELPGQNCLECTHTHTHVSTPHITLEMFLTTAPLVYLEQTEGSSLARLVVDVLLGVSQKHLQLRLRDVVGFDILHQNGHGLGKRKHVTSFSIIFKPHFKEYDAFYTLKQFWTRW